VDEKWESDPIARVEATLREANSDTGSALTAAKEEMRRAFEIARDTPYPPVAHAFTDVQDIGDPRVDAY
jgi:pyruvate dehydrogenase E1 component alpha subunit